MLPTDDRRLTTIYTFGHSTRSIKLTLEILKAHDIKTLCDIRAFPVSRRMPHFNREAFEPALAQAGIGYLWLKELGGRRKKTLQDSPHVALRNDSFRNYADHMLSDEFKRGIAQVLAAAERGRTTIMCAEAVYFHCHRMLVSDYLVAHGHQVLHITDANPPRPHKLTKEARLVGDDVIYKGDRLF